MFKYSMFKGKGIVMKRNMMRTMTVVLMTLVTVGMMAQPPHGGRGPEGHGDRNHGGRGGHDRQRVECASKEQIHMAVQVLEDQSFDDKRLEIAKLCVTLGQFCTDDLERMARTFTFDENRKKFLTYAHRYCSDPWNYYSLRDVFEFRTNFDDMMEKISK